jgi:hypothetical protein
LHVSGDDQEREQGSEDNPNIDLAHQNSPLARPGPSCGIHCRHIKLGVIEQRQLNRLAEGGNVSLPNQ